MSTHAPARHAASAIAPAPIPVFPGCANSDTAPLAPVVELPPFPLPDPVPEPPPPAPVGRGLPPPVIFAVAVPEGAGEPPTAADSCAKPTEGGLKRKTEYTFFYFFKIIRFVRSDQLERRGCTKKVSPTTHAGTPPPPAPFVPASRSNIPPRHWVPPVSTAPRLKSSGLIDHVFEPKFIVTVTEVLHAVWNNYDKKTANCR